MKMVETNAYSFLVDNNGRTILGWGKVPPSLDWITKGAKFFDEDAQKEYYWTGSAWSEILSNPNFNGEYWDDLRFPAQGVNPPGAVSDPSVDDGTGLLLFSGSADNIIAGVAQMPHAWEAGSAIRPHLHLIAPTAAENVSSRWKFEYNRANNLETYENAYGSYTELSTITVDNPNDADTLLLPDGFGDLDMTGYRESCCILWKISRLANSDAADDDTEDWALVEFDIHYQIDKTGTITEIPT